MATSHYHVWTFSAAEQRANALRGRRTLGSGVDGAVRRSRPRTTPQGTGLPVNSYDAPQRQKATSSTRWQRSSNGLGQIDGPVPVAFGAVEQPAPRESQYA